MALDVGPVLTGEYVPMSHAVQSSVAFVFPDPVPYVPVGHAIHWEESDTPVLDWYVPSLHSTQAALEKKPVPVWYVPMAHSVQAPLDDTDTTAVPVPYVPVVHRKHAMDAVRLREFE